MVNPKLTNKRLVKCLMDTKGIDIITVTKDKVLVEVGDTFTPKDGLSLVRKVGHSQYQPVTRNGKNFIILERY